MAKKMLLIDGHSLLFRAFFGMPLSMTAPDGTHTNAIYGFLTIFRKMCRDTQPDAAAVAFDTKEKTFRHELYPDYKGNRAAADPEFKEQVPLMQELLGEMGVKVFTCPGFEADDVLGTLAARGEAEGYEVFILSGDRDLLQLATDKTKVIIPKFSKGTTVYETYDAAAVKEALGVTPKEFIDMKALMGDSSDNYHGLPGVGKVSAQKVIAQYHSIENAKAHSEELKPKKVREAFENEYPSAQLCKELAAIRTDAPVEADFSELSVRDFRSEELKEHFRKLNFKRFIQWWDEDEAAKDLNDGKKGFDFSIVKNGADFAAAISGFDRSEPVGAGLFVNGLYSCAAISQGGKTVALVPGEGMEGDLVLLAFAEALPFDAEKDGGTAAAGKFTDACVMHAKPVFKALAGSMGSDEVPTCAADHFSDMALAAYLIDPLKSDWGYASCAAAYLDAAFPDEKEVMGKKPELLFKEDRAAYAERAAKVAAYEAYTAISMRADALEKLKETEMERLYREVEMPLTAVLASMELKGIRCDAAALKSYGENLQGHIDSLENKIYEEAGEAFNINSPRQLGSVLFEKLKLPGGRKTKTGYSTAADVLEGLAPDYPIAANVLEYRMYEKLKSTYADGLASCIEGDGRIRTTYQQTVTATGRLSSTDPNLQNIPMRTELGRSIRKCFFPSEGCVFADADYSQIELRVLAHMSGDEKLIEAYREAKDIHAATASEVFGVPIEEVTDELRRKAKAVNFGIVYGISSFGLSQGLSISRKEAERYIEKYFESYPKLKGFLDGCVKSAKEKGYAVSLCGRRRPVPELAASNFVTRSFGERVAMNSPIQGTAADIMKMAMVKTAKRLEKEGSPARILLQIHDELLLEVPEADAQEAKRMLKEEMEGAIELSVPLIADCHIGRDWYSAK